jgi:curli production assembly/transport component CsgF
MKYFQYLIPIIAIVFTGNVLSAQEMVWRPTNPAFGGNPYNYQWMLSSAQAQNKLTETTDRDRFLRDPLADFQSSLQRQILNQLSRQLITQMYGEVGLEEGRYEFGEFIIEVTPGAEGLEVHIFDVSTGGETSIIIPYF